MQTKTERDVAELVHLSLEQVAVGYQGIEVVSDVNLTLGNGQIGCLLGPSGCGKSTLLRAIAGFEPLMAGKIVMDGELLSSKVKTKPPEKRRIGMVFQDLALFPHLNVTENIAFGLRDWSVQEKAARVASLLKLVGLEGMEKRYPHALSGGQQQRIALARAMAPRPKLLLLDEPFSGLDASMTEALVPEVREILLKEQVSALVVTHDQVEAFTIADRVSVMREGCVLQTDAPYNIYHRPETPFVADFVGEGDFLSGIVVDDFSVRTALGVLRSSTPHNYAINQAVEVLVRPDDLLHDDDSEVTGKIITKRFRGSHFLYRIELPSKQRLFCFASSHHNHAIGEHIGVNLDLDHLVVFPQAS